MITVDLDSASWKVINTLSNSMSSWHRHMHDNLPEELAKKAEEHFKPMLHVRPDHTNKLEESIRHVVHRSGDGWQVDFFGLYYGLYMDIGNFPPGAVLDAHYYGRKAFPIDKRLGKPIFRSTIHGMGARTPEAPTHYSEKTAEWLAQGAALEVAYDHVMRFLSEVVK